MPDPSSNQPRVICVQDGARLNYVIPRVLERLGWLDRVWTDFFVRPGSLDAVIAAIGNRPGNLSGNRMKERCCEEIENRVKTFPLRSLWWRRGRSRFVTAEDYFEWLAKKTATWMLKQDFGKSNLIHGFIRNLDPDFCAEMQRRGLRIVGDQMIAPARIEAQEMAAQRDRWPGWDETSHGENERLGDIEEKTWAHLDHITCASEYVKEGLMTCGVDEDKISVLPYPSPHYLLSKPVNNGKSAKVRIGFIGSISLRKGAPVFLEMARRFGGKSAEFMMVGPIALPQQKQIVLKEHVTLTGPVPRSQVAEYLQSFDIFLFPSRCEGSASVVMEALAMGLPVVTTPNSGSIVQHGVQGFVHRPEDLDGISTSLERLLLDPSLRKQFGAAALLRSKEYNLATYQQSLLNLLPDILQ